MFSSFLLLYSMGQYKINIFSCKINLSMKSANSFSVFLLCAITIYLFTKKYCIDINSHRNKFFNFSLSRQLNCNIYIRTSYCIDRLVLLICGKIGLRRTWLYFLCNIVAFCHEGQRVPVSLTQGGSSCMRLSPGGRCTY